MTDQAKQAPDTTVDRADTAVLGLTVGATVAALTLSFRNQIDFATQRGGYPVWGAILWALIIDSPVIVGELRLYSAAARSEGWRIKAWAWTITLVGLVISMSAGAAHVTIPASFPVKVLAAVIPPLMAAASLGTGLGIVKLRNRSPSGAQTTQERDEAVATTPRPAASRVRQPGITARQARSKASATAPSYAQLAAWAAADAGQGLPMGRVSFTRRHADEGLTEHYAKQFLTSRSNGDGDRQAEQV
jgi:hypothetical protein